jgi:hypothetical protein
MIEIFVQSRTAKDGTEGVVELCLDNKSVVVSPDSARAFAFNVLAAAEAAEQDSFMTMFARDVLQIQDRRIIMDAVIPITPAFTRKGDLISD